MALAEMGLTVGRETVKLAVKSWTGLRGKRVERNSQLIDLLVDSVPDAVKRRQLARRLEDIVEHVAVRIRPFYDVEFHDLPENEKRAALIAATDTLTSADLSDTALFEARFDSRAIARTVRDRLPIMDDRQFGDRAAAILQLSDVPVGLPSLDSNQHTVSGLSTKAFQLYLRVVDDACLSVVKILQQLPAFEPRALSHLIKDVGEASDAIEEVLERLPRTTLDAPGGTEEDWNFRDRYIDHISGKLDGLEIFGVDIRRYRPHTRVSVAYLSLRVTSDTPEHDWGHNGTAIGVESALALAPRTLVRGEAGCGKTTLLQWIAVNAARGTFVGPLSAWNDHTPVLVRLRRYAEGDLPVGDAMLGDVAPVLLDIQPKGWVHRQLKSGKAVLLVDGVDELPPRRRKAVRGWLQDILREYPTIPIVVTTRPAAVDAAWLTAESFASVSIEPMTVRDIEVFCGRWHEAIRDATRRGMTNLPCEPADLVHYERALLRHLDSRNHLKALAASPLLCAMLCALNLDRRMHLPPDRMQLYEEALKLLVNRRDLDRDLPADTVLTALSVRARLEVLQHLAWSAMLAGKAEFSLDDARIFVANALRRMPDIDVEPGVVMSQLLERSGVVRQPTVGQVDFIHRTFQEYLAAKQATDEHLIDMLIARAGEDQWRETIVMAVGHATPPNRERLLVGILRLAETQPRQARRLHLLAAACLDTATVVAPEVSSQIEHEMTRLFPPRSSSESRIVALVGERGLSYVPRLLSSHPEETATACVELAGYIGGGAALDLLAGYAIDERPAVQRAIMRAWKYFAGEDFARRVLSRAHLVDGGLIIETAEQLNDAAVIDRLIHLEIEMLNGAPVKDLGFLDAASNLRTLAVETSHGVGLTSLGKHTGLRRLAIKGAGVVDGWEALANLTELTWLELDGAPADCVLRHAGSLGNLRVLRLVRAHQVTDLEPLAHMHHLAELSLKGCDRLHDVSALARLPRLRRVEINHAFLPGGLYALRDTIPQLDTLVLGNVPTINSLDPLQGSRLRHLELDGRHLRDLRPLGAIDSLEHLAIRDNAADLDWSPLRKLGNLRVLDVRDSAMMIDARLFRDRARRLELIVRPSQHVAYSDAVGESVRVRVL
ncbi:NACHT domain-containing protein [Actinoplanes sp. NPDC049681]|uniref:NACHT domain-containing protein n=1 Tax=Actinoplanes sp. NPDC049681 TaxID=3363905 RepID=UPI0037A69AD6